MTVLVLTGSFRETDAFTKSRELGYGIRHITNRDTLRAVGRVTEVHELPSFRQRRDIHALQVEINRIRRRNPELIWNEHEFGPDGDLQLVGAPFEPVDPTPNPRARRRKAAVAKNLDVAIDKGPDAVPGQLAIEEPAEQNPRSAPDDDFLSFLDES